MRENSLVELRISQTIVETKAPSRASDGVFSLREMTEQRKHILTLLGCFISCCVVPNQLDGSFGPPPTHGIFSESRIIVMFAGFKKKQI
jgi:hypothetical protein